MARPIAFSPRNAASGDMIAIDVDARERRSIAGGSERTLQPARLLLLRDRMRRGVYETPHAREELARRILAARVL
jgi:hypothetical protein